MKICHFITRFVRGGADENTLLSCNAQVASGHATWLVYGDEHHPEMLQALDPRVERVCIPSLKRAISPIDDTRALVASVRLLVQIKPDIVHTHTSKAGVIGRIAARLTRVPGVIHGVHIVPWINASPLEARIYMNIERSLAPFTDAFIDVADEIRDVCTRSGVGHIDRHHVICSGMELRRFHRNAARVDWRTLIDPAALHTTNPKFLVHVSALEPRKRQRQFLDVFATIAAADDDAVLVFVGDGPEREPIETAISQLGLGGRAICVGFRRDVESWMSIASVCLLTSLREGLARVLVQYALVGRPIVATDIPGSRTIVRDGVNGFLVPTDQLDRIPDHVLAILRDESLARRLEAGSRAIDFSPWSVETMATQLEAVYQRLLSSRVSTRSA